MIKNILPQDTEEKQGNENPQEETQYNVSGAILPNINNPLAQQKTSVPVRSYINDLFAHVGNPLSHEAYYPDNSSVIKGQAFGMPIITASASFPFAMMDEVLYNKAQERKQKAELMNKLTTDEYSKTIDPNRNSKLQDYQISYFKDMRNKYLSQVGTKYKSQLEALYDMKSSGEYRTTINAFNIDANILNKNWELSGKILNPAASEKELTPPQLRESARKYREEAEDFNMSPEGIKKLIEKGNELSRQTGVYAFAKDTAKALSKETMSFIKDVSNTLGTTANKAIDIISTKGYITEDDINSIPYLSKKDKDYLMTANKELEKQIDDSYNKLIEDKSESTGYSKEQFRTMVINNMSHEVKNNLKTEGTGYAAIAALQYKKNQEVNKGYIAKAKTTGVYGHNVEEWDLTKNEDKKDITATITPDGVVGTYEINGGVAKVGKEEKGYFTSGKFATIKIQHDLETGITYAIVAKILPKTSTKIKSGDAILTEDGNYLDDQQYVVPLNKVESAIKTQIGKDSNGKYKIESLWNEEVPINKTTNKPYKGKVPEKKVIVKSGEDLN